MIVKKLRKQNNWSQEQLATMSGLNVRTIQRVESGQKASLETLKCLASVFNVDIERLTEEIVVIDKDSAAWKKQPWWFRVNFIGIKSKKPVLVLELIMLFLALMSWIFDPHLFITPTLFLSAYTTGWLLRYGDSKNAW
ncbi:helix-turn-helix transcriptional regulator [Aliikangiella marina]|uniref:Helix-turn-helix transcriptional regulator n=1 Tax=Aliikangiella marina TaxID=1712262 RepID=A0A545T9Z6_9GAMM|nr:helix-turn-helix transcriptional regulator [Aliikangiella marina]TQV74039.1 helix-turn-helix transcriptional regulator [Aliikangiella marina]